MSVSSNEDVDLIGKGNIWYSCVDFPAKDILQHFSIVLCHPFLVSQVLHCKCWVGTVTFPVTVTQQSPAAVSMDTYQITIAPMMAKVQKHFEDIL